MILVVDCMSMYDGEVMKLKYEYAMTGEKGREEARAPSLLAPYSTSSPLRAAEGKGRMDRERERERESSRG